ncbi:MAG: glycosyltransferase family 2 protein [Novosphingobium sp.]
MTPGTIAITMAGMGSRFHKAGYTFPKYQIEVGGHFLFDWSMMGLRNYRDAGWEFFFATRAEDQCGVFLKDRCDALGIALSGMIELNALTDGQATTALFLAEQATENAPFAVFNIDTFVAPDAIGPAHIPQGSHGWIPCFPGIGDSWSFARADETGRIHELREKQRISDDATIGFYYFSSASLYRKTYEEFFVGSSGEEKGERYIAPMCNQLIEDGALVTIKRLAFNEVGTLGTPEQVADFSAHPPISAMPFFQRSPLTCMSSPPKASADATSSGSESF